MDSGGSSTLGGNAGSPVALPALAHFLLTSCPGQRMHNRDILSLRIQVSSPADDVGAQRLSRHGPLSALDADHGSNPA